MSKYIIDLRDDCKVVQQICESNGQVCIGARSIQYLEELTADYINEHFGSLQDDAYKRGLEDGKAQAERGCEGCRYECENKRRVPCILCSDNIKLPSSISPSKLKSQWTAKDVRIKGCEGCMYQDTTIEHNPCNLCCNAFLNRWTAKDDKMTEEKVTSNICKNCRHCVFPDGDGACYECTEFYDCQFESKEESEEKEVGYNY